MKHQPLLCGLGMALLLPLAAPGETGPTAVSPGSLDGFVGSAHRCPTFSWAPPAQATPLELVVYDVSAAGGWSPFGRPKIHQQLPPRTTSWTPPLGRCLSAGGRYAWLLRSAREGEEARWSEALLFAVEGGPSADPTASVTVEAAPRERQRDEAGAEAATEDSPRTLQVDGPGSSATSPRNEAARIQDPSGDDLWVDDDLFLRDQLYFPEYTYWRETHPAPGFLLGSERETDELERSTAGFAYIRAPQTGDLDVYLVAPLDVPSDGEPLDWFCHIYDNHGTANVQVEIALHRRHQESHWIYAANTESTSGADTDLISVWGYVAGLPEDRNVGEYWWLEVHWQPEAAGSLLRFYGCSVRMRMDRLRF